MVQQPDLNLSLSEKYVPFFHCMLLCVTSFSSTVWSVHFALLPSSCDIFRLNLTPFDGFSKRGNKHDPEYCGFKCVALNNDAA